MFMVTLLATSTDMNDVVFASDKALEQIVCMLEMLSLTCVSFEHPELNMKTSVHCPFPIPFDTCCCVERSRNRMKIASLSLSCLMMWT